jgi:hypothetical protein
VRVAVLFRRFIFPTVRIAASGFAYYPDEDRDGDDEHDYQDEQRSNGYGQGVSSREGTEAAG